MKENLPLESAMMSAGEEQSGLEYSVKNGRDRRSVLAKGEMTADQVAMVIVADGFPEVQF